MLFSGNFLLQRGSRALLLSSSPSLPPLLTIIEKISIPATSSSSSLSSSSSSLLALTRSEPIKETRRCYSLLSSTSKNSTIISSSSHYYEASARQRHARSFFSFSFSNSSDNDDGDDEKSGGPSRATKELIIVRHGETDWNKEKLIQGGQTDVELNSVGKDQAEKTGKAILEYLLLKGEKEEEGEEQKNQEREMKYNIKIYSSPLLRTVETAHIISEKLSSLPQQQQKSKSSSIPIIKSNAIQEWDLASLEGLNVEQATAQYPNSWNILKEWYNPYVSEELISIPIEENGESMEDVRMRIESYLENIVYGGKDNTDDAIIIVTHGAVLGQLLRHIVVSQHDDDDDGSATDISIDGGTSENNDEQQQQQNQYHRPQNACITRITICPNTWKWTIIDWANADHFI